MKVVIADTSPLNYLVLVDAIEILPRLYTRVTIPDVVLQELTAQGAPKKVSAWATNRPQWVEVLPSCLSKDPLLEELDDGEHAAILLAQRKDDVLLVIDDALARTEAERRGIRTIGTLGVLRAASIREFIALPAVLTRFDVHQLPRLTTPGQ